MGAREEASECDRGSGPVASKALPIGWREEESTCGSYGRVEAVWRRGRLARGEASMEVWKASER
ncbi:unnamed protein product [Dovyalis caffra]|uniref:Uncharacterized protein n=1 Tax=Dovyalis caffra TaxID=77055 RepID=A0AAV1RBU3_9ROSI|nr:unnamed protein product [Dovyalis caffra]